MYILTNLKKIFDSKKNEVEIYKSKNTEFSMQMVKSLNIKEGHLIYDISLTGGISILNGLIRLLGSGSKELERDLLNWNQHVNDKEILLVADDIFGGFFAINLGFLQGEIGNIFYLAPDNLQWEDMNINYYQFIYWLFNNNVEKFYEHLLWAGYLEDTKNICHNNSLLIYPFLWSKECNIETAEKKEISVSEMYKLQIDMQKKISNF